MPIERARPAPTTRSAAPKRVAVLLNGNAKQVTPALADRMRSVVGDENVFYSKSLAEAESFAAKVVRDGYPTVAIGGGDGSVVVSSGMVRKAADQQGVAAPEFGVLALGTGNALKTVVNAGDPVADLTRIVNGETKTTQLNLIQDGAGHQFPFAGIGHSAQLLHDYNLVREKLPGAVPAKVAYGIAGLVRTVPRYLFSKHGRDVVITSSKPSYSIDNAGNLRWIPAGTELYRGKMEGLDVGSVPELGCKIRMFPDYDRMEGHMQLRVSSMSLWKSSLHMKDVWAGKRLDSKEVLNFLVRDVDVAVSKETTYQHSGEESGKVDTLRFEMAPGSLQVLVQDPSGVAGGAQNG